MLIGKEGDGWTEKTSIIVFAKKRLPDPYWVQVDPKETGLIRIRYGTQKSAGNRGKPESFDICTGWIYPKQMRDHINRHFPKKRHFPKEKIVKSCECEGNVCYCDRAHKKHHHQKVIVYHIDDPNFSFATKKDGIYKDMQWLWGNAITNKAKRTEKDFASWMEPDGSVRHTFTKGAFDIFLKKHCKHNYDLRPFTTNELDDILSRIQFMTHDQVLLLQGALRTRNK